ncbi:hypothetical protein B0T17DRAFT_524397 [Bombardia bombarda]|uniref:Secreted protein n=1 Tax=Bombardia bombarda TaxID=252184 RepID=A0AA39X810_9PEZI|nr:hypothetical protein B0T17DRAFT_524397 [Bombardia bombarda]
MGKGGRLCRLLSPVRKSFPILLALHLLLNVSDLSHFPEWPSFLNFFFTGMLMRTLGKARDDGGRSNGIHRCGIINLRI